MNEVCGSIEGVNLQGGFNIKRALEIKVDGEEEIRTFYCDGQYLRNSFSHNGFDEEDYKFKLNDRVVLKINGDTILGIHHERRKVYSIILEYCGRCPNCIEEKSGGWINFGGMILTDTHYICAAMDNKETKPESPIPEWCPLSNISDK